MSLVKLEDLKTNMCRWPEGDPQEEDFHFCACDKMEGSPYCAEHMAMAHRSYEKDKRKKVA
jgi:GcrA cell cycle regulator